MHDTEQTVFDDERFELQFVYPRSVYEHPVEYEEEKDDDQITVRLTSNQRRDVYFEVSRFSEAQAHAMYDWLRYHSEATGAQWVSAAESALVDDNVALTFSLQRGNLYRKVFLIQRAHDVYRITYNPLHPTNYRILETLVFKRE